MLVVRSPSIWVWSLWATPRFQTKNVEGTATLLEINELIVEHVDDYDTHVLIHTS